MIKKLLIILLLLCLPSIGWPDKWVTSSGAGARNGTSLGNAWSQSDFESESGTGYAGDTFYFSGTFTSQLDINISGTAGNYVTLDGFEANDTTYMNLVETIGRAKIDTNASDNCIEIDNKDFITIQDFEITDCDTDGISVFGTSHDIIIKRTYIHTTIQGISVFGSGTYNVTIGGTRNHGNVLKNLGQTTAHEDIAIWQGAKDVIISYNHLYADDTDWGVDGILITTGASEVLIENNSIHDHNGDDFGEDGIDMKKFTTHDIIIRYNNIYGHADTDSRSQSCIQAQSGVDNVYVYGNRCYRNQAGISAGDSEDDNTNDQIYIFSNIVDSHEEHGVIIGFQGNTYDTWVFNNTLIKNGTCTEKNGVDECQTFGSNTRWGNIKVNTVQNSTTIKNNILYKGRPNDDNYQQYYVATDSDTKTTADSNLYYWPSQTSTIFWGDSDLLTLAQVKAGSSNGLPQEDDVSKPGNDENPDLENIDADDYRIASSGSGAYDAGTDMGSGNIVSLTINGETVDVPWDFGLGPNTVWGGGSTLPVIDEVNRDDYQWDVGAYVHVESVGHKGVSIN